MEAVIKSSSFSSFLHKMTMDSKATENLQHEDTSGEIYRSTIPESLKNEKSKLEPSKHASISVLKNSIETCKQLLITADLYTNERKWLLENLINLKMRLHEEDEKTKKNDFSNKISLEHHFEQKKISLKNRTRCYQCAKLIWMVGQTILVCQGCFASIHLKCLEYVDRPCEHAMVSQKRKFNERICPEIGVAMQLYKCADCSILFIIKGTVSETRLCQYTGLYYCTRCHWNDTSIIPARIMHNWDFSPYKVCQKSIGEIKFLYEEPIINLEQFNPRLMFFVPILSTIKKLREDIYYMKKYLSTCRLAKEALLLDTKFSGLKNYWIQAPELYSLSDLVSIKTDDKKDKILNKVYSTYNTHIRNCLICTGKGYICTICGENEAIFPFDNSVINCNKCNSVYHRQCWALKKMECMKCHLNRNK